MGVSNRTELRLEVWKLAAAFRGRFDWYMAEDGDFWRSGPGPRLQETVVSLGATGLRIHEVAPRSRAEMVELHAAWTQAARVGATTGRAVAEAEEAAEEAAEAAEEAAEAVAEAEEAVEEAAEAAEEAAEAAAEEDELRWAAFEWSAVR